MTRCISNRIFAIFLALMVLVSSTGFTINIHYCQENIAGITFISQSNCCKNRLEKKSCHSSKSTPLDEVVSPEKPCCHDESVIVEKSDLDAISANIAISQDFNQASVDTYVLLNVFYQTFQSEVQRFNYYKSPLPDRDIQVLYQTFLI